MPQGSRIVTAGLIVVVLGLLAVGMVSQTLFRHAVQVIPVLVALLGVSRRMAWGRAAALTSRSTGPTGRESKAQG